MLDRGPDLAQTTILHYVFSRRVIALSLTVSQDCQGCGTSMWPKELEGKRTWTMNCSPVKEILTHCMETRHGAKELLTVEKTFLHMNCVGTPLSLPQISLWLGQLPAGWCQPKERPEVRGELGKAAASLTKVGLSCCGATAWGSKELCPSPAFLHGVGHLLDISHLFISYVCKEEKKKLVERNSGRVSSSALWSELAVLSTWYYHCKPRPLLGSISVTRLSTDRVVSTFYKAGLLGHAFG